MEYQKGYLDSNEHPRGLNPEDRKRFHEVSLELVALYRKMRPGDTARMIIGGLDEESHTVSLLMFKSNLSELMEVVEFIRGL
jgi:hypothetical protein